MIVIENESIIPFDVDGTLVTRKPIPGVEPLIFNNYGILEKLYPMRQHIDLIKKSKARGKYVIVWSKNGVTWCKEIIKMLELEEFVDMAITKPTDYVDDLPADSWMSRVFIHET